VVSPPETVDAVPFTDDGMPEALEEEEGGGWVRDLEQDIREFCGQGLLHERLVGHPVAFFQKTISILSGGKEAAYSKRFPSTAWPVRDHRTGRHQRRGTGRDASRPCPSSPFLRKSKHRVGQEGGKGAPEDTRNFPSGGPPF